MISALESTKTNINQSSSLKIKTGCIFEYNMNRLVDNIIVSGSEYVAADGSKPFKKLFPIDSIIKPNRPLSAGIKYAISGDVSQNSYRNPKSISYPISYRTYYPGVETIYKYYVSQKGSGLNVTITYPKTILTNKIVARFELGHSTPPTWTITANGSSIATGNSSSIIPFGSNNAGTLTIYWNGTTWSTSEPSVPSSPVSVTSIGISTAGVTNKYIGLIELCPKWTIDISDRITEFSLSKESSTGADEILPVGKITANSLSLSLVSYEDNRTVQTFDKTNNFDSSKIYIYKQIEIKPYFKIYHSSGNLSDSEGSYEKIEQGVFYCDNWTTEEFGEVGIEALDSAKLLQETMCPNIVCEGYSVTGIIRRLLDAVGFTSYNINLLSTETSPLSPRYWWSDDTKTVWQALQEICRDAQITAVCDEKNILQFYTRDYIFSPTRSTDWNFRYSNDGLNLANILSLNKTDLPSANQIKVLWNSVTTNQYAGGSQQIWSSANSFMGALSLEQNLLSTMGEGSFVSLKAVETNEYSDNQILFEYSGYLVIDSEIIEYDAIEYQYEKEDGSKVLVLVQSDSDVLKFLGLGAIGSDKYIRTGRVRIKSRGAFGTIVDNHYAAAQDILNSWSGYEVTWV